MSECESCARGDAYGGRASTESLKAIGEQRESVAAQTRIVVRPTAARATTERPALPALPGAGCPVCAACCVALVLVAAGRVAKAPTVEVCASEEVFGQ